MIGKASIRQSRLRQGFVISGMKLRLQPALRSQKPDPLQVGGGGPPTQPIDQRQVLIDADIGGGGLAR